MEDSEGLGRPPVVFVDLGQPLRKVIHHPEDGLVQRNLYELVLRKDLRDFLAERLVHPVVVVGVKEATGQEILPQGRPLVGREAHVPVAGHV